MGSEVNKSNEGVRGCNNLCDQIWKFLKVRGNKSSYKSSPSIWQLSLPL